MRARIAVVDDAPRMAEVLAMVLRSDGHDVQPFTRPEDLLEVVSESPSAFDLVLTDLKMPNIDGIALLERLHHHRADLPVILVTAHATVETAIAALKQGAFDYLQKPVDNAVCRAAVRRALAHGRLARENRHLRAQLEHTWGSADNSDIIAVSEASQAVFDLARRAAGSTATVLLTGESGTGKEVVARAIHAHSHRVGRPFEAVNCKAFATGVLESELFGHEKGAFTGADRARPGLFERADGGTVLLDEIGEIDGGFQAKLLRVLQEGEVQRVGGDRPRKVDVRIIAATRRDLAADAQAGNFRDDLYFRLAVIPIVVPPLRERRADILPLARHFLAVANRQQGRRIEGWDAAVERWLLSHPWPGNVRELANAIERGVVLARGETIEYADLLLGPAGMNTRGSTGEPGDVPTESTLHGFLDAQAKEKISAVLREVRGVRVDAARILGVERTTLYRLMRKYGIE
ncbi:MAG: sigma-54-dependent Fis family transcriptional regulator [Myxococcales bacterium]|nr:sigma-54-dependent Fis family transcriptional regulator [Myxococcales bacterium]